MLKQHFNLENYLISRTAPSSTWELHHKGPKWPLIVETSIESINEKIKTIFNTVYHLSPNGVLRATTDELQDIYLDSLLLQETLQDVDLDSLKITVANLENSHDFVELFKEKMNAIKNDTSLADDIMLSEDGEPSDIVAKVMEGDYYQLLRIVHEEQSRAPPKYITDPTSGKLYLNESEANIRLKCGALAVSSPLTHILAPMQLACYHIRESRYEELAKDVARIAVSPITALGLGSIALGGALLDPLEARKWHAAGEKVVYNNEFYMAPCFQPIGTSNIKHGLGGDPDIANAW